jgi:hypothetical protein
LLGLADLPAKLEQLSPNDPRRSNLAKMISRLKDEIAARKLGTGHHDREP